MWRVTLSTCLIGLAFLAVTVAPGSAARGQWVWSPGLCKSNLKHFGVELSDGRTFGVADAFCVGRGGLKHCEWTSASHVKRLYDEFLVVVRSADGNVRRAELYTTGKKTYELDGIKLILHEGSSAAFNAYAAPITASWAKQEQALGCSEP